MLPSEEDKVTLAVQCRSLMSYYSSVQVAESEERVSVLQQKHEAEVKGVRQEQEAELIALRRHTEDQASRLQQQLSVMAGTLAGIKEEYSRLQSLSSAWPGILSKTVQSTVSQVLTHNTTQSTKHYGKNIQYSKLKESCLRLAGCCEIACVNHQHKVALTSPNQPFPAASLSSDGG